MRRSALISRDLGFRAAGGDELVLVRHVDP
jgi:hypothetical protein